VTESIQIRNFNFLNDYPEVLKLWENAGDGIHLHRSDENDEILKKLDRDPDLFLIAESRGRIIGAVMGAFDGRRGMVYHLAVAYSHRRRRLGRLLMEELEKRLRSKGCIRCYLMVAPENLEAASFYEDAGWSKLDLYVFGKDITE